MYTDDRTVSRMISHRIAYFSMFMGLYFVVDYFLHTMV